MLPENENRWIEENEERHTKKRLEKPVINYVPLMSVRVRFLFELVPISRRTGEIYRIKLVGGWVK